MKFFKKPLPLVIASVGLLATTSTLFSCANNNDTVVKIGVLVSDTNGDEAKAFRSYYENYIENNYKVDFTYTEALVDAAAERSAIETFAAQGYSAIISLSASDRAMQIETCESNKIYYAVASGMLDDDQYAKYASNEYFLGQIGPDMATEYNAGKAMGEYYKNTVKVSSVALYGAFIPNPMHVYRTAGVLSGLGLTYGSSSEMGAVVGQLFADQGVTLSKVAGDIALKAYVQGFNPETVYGEVAGAIAQKPDAFLSVGMATTFFSSTFAGANMDYSDIDAFTESNVAQMKQEGGKLTYLAGKYASSIGPVFALVYNACRGNLIKNDGKAVSLGQGYGVATTSEVASRYQTADSGDNPIINKTLLDTIIGEKVSYDDLAKFVATDRTPA